MNTMKGIESRIKALGREIVQLKVARNALTLHVYTATLFPNSIGVDVVIKELSRCDAPKLRDLLLSGNFLDSLGSAFAQLGRLALLSTLTLCSVSVTATPYFQDLTKVRFKYVDCSIRKMYQFLWSSPKLVDVVLVKAVASKSLVNYH